MLYALMALLGLQNKQDTQLRAQPEDYKPRRRLRLWPFRRKKRRVELHEIW
jgi:hypothetical protein